MSTEKRCTRSEQQLLQDWLAQTRFEAEVLANNRYCGNWRIELSGHFAMPFHLIGAGGCLLRTATGCCELQEGDWLFFARDSWHELLPLPGQETAVIVLCGQIQAPGLQQPSVFDWLPDVWHVRQLQDRAGERLRLLTELFVHEAYADAADNRQILNRLCEALLAMLLRDYAAALDGQGVLQAAQDPRLARALLAMHRQPASPWTVEELASVAAMSRTGFAVAFHEQTGLSPMEYLTRWRMHKAISLLQTRTRVDRVAECVGYQSESAFRKAFKRVTGQPLSAYR